MRPKIEYINHTADIGLIVRAPELEQLFVYSAKGMFSLIADTTSSTPDEIRKINVTAEDIVHLMHGWLSELLFVHETEHIIPIEYKISELTEQSLIAVIKGCPIQHGNIRLFREIKAVTMHNLEVKFNGTYWEAHVIFDI